MARNNMFVSVPSFFKCPISMDVMKSPVSLCTGVTYDRSSIQKWLDGGHNTCPATMQVLPSTDFVPNHTLQRLIVRWSLSLDSKSTSDDFPSPSSSVCFSSQARALSLVRSLESSGRDNRLNCLSKIIAFAEESEENRRCFAKIDGFVPAVAGELSGTSGDDCEASEFILKALRLTVSEIEIRDGLLKLVRESDRLLSSIVSILRGRSSEAKVEAAKVLEAMACDAESKRAIAGREGLVYELCRLLSSNDNATWNPMAVEAGLSALIALTASRAVKAELVRFGMVRAVAEILGDWKVTSAGGLEKALRLLEMVSTCSEGRAAICEDPTCVAAVVQRMWKPSSAAATEHAVVVIWSLCYLFRDQTAQEAVMRNNGPTKMLVLMQSNCTPAVRQMCADLLKAFRVNSKSCLAGYETRTTHIMPF